MSRTAIKITENLLIRRIDPVVMLRRYLAGEFKNVTMPSDKVILSTAFVNLSQRVWTDQTSETYRFSDKTNSGQVIITTNHEQYRYAKDGSDTGEEKPIAYCLWCRREIKTNPIGIPIEMETDKHTNNIIFNIEDTYDTFGCALAALKKIYSCHYMHKDPLYMDAEQMLHCLYHKMHPDKLGTRILEANDWRLLKNNGGPLEDEEFDNDQCIYVQIPNVVTVPIKRQYIKLNLGKKN
jgi:hypothetical protein